MKKKLILTSTRPRRRRLYLPITPLLFCRVSHDESYRVTVQIRKLKNAMGEYTEIKLVKDNPDGYCEFIIPKKWCKVSFPRILSDEQKAKMTEHLKAARTLRW